MILSSILFLSASRLLSLVDCKAAPKLGLTVPAFSSNMRTMFQDSQGNYWFGSDAEGASRYDGKSIVRFTTNDGLAGNQVAEIKEDKRGNLFFVTSGGISKYDGKSFTTLKPVVMDTPNKGWRLHPDDLWFTFGPRDGGTSRYDGKTLYCLRFPMQRADDAKRIPSAATGLYAIYTIYKDKRGFLWFGTATDGLCRYDGKTVNWLYEEHLTTAPNGGSFGIRSIIEDRDGKLWVCNTRNRYTISPSNRPTHGLIQYTTEKGTGSLQSIIGNEALYFQSVAKGSEGDLWLMPWRGGIFRYDGIKTTHYPVKDGDNDAPMSLIYKDRQGTLWICSQTGGPYRFNGKAFEKVAPPRI